jgi:GTP cyclohydrolase I
MSTKVKVSFPANEKTITVEKEVGEHENIAHVVNALLAEIDSLEVRVPGKATPEQIRALYGKAFSRGWDKDRVKSFLEERFGTSNEDEMVGKVDRMELSRLIDEIGGAVEMPGKATVAQMRALWGKALGRGWDRERIRMFLEEQLGTSVEEEIVGKIDRDKLSVVIDEIDEF